MKTNPPSLLTGGKPLSSFKRILYTMIFLLAGFIILNIWMFGVSVLVWMGSLFMLGVVFTLFIVGGWMVWNLYNTLRGIKGYKQDG